MADVTGRGGRISGLIPLVVVGVIVVLLARSCMQGFGFGGDDDRAPEGTDQGLGQVTEGDGGDSEGGVQLDDAAGGPATTRVEDPEAMLEPRDPVCPDPDGEAERHLRWTEAPDPDELCIDPAQSYSATLVTSEGDIVIDLDTANAPYTVNNLVFLAGWGFYDGTRFDVVLPEVLVQIGEPGEVVESDVVEADPTAASGYTFDDEFLPVGDEPYPRYAVAMFNDASGSGTNSSEFFIVSGTEMQTDGPLYPRFGQISDAESQAVVDAIDRTGDTTPGAEGSVDGPPVVIHTVVIETVEEQ